MNKGIFFIPINKQDKENDILLDEIVSETINAEKFGIQEAFYGEHITDKHEKISSSLMMVSALTTVTNNIKLGTLTTNLNFHKPATLAAMISQVDNLSKGRLMLGIGCGANMSDVEAIDMLDKNNHKIMLETFDILKKIFNKKSPFNIETENFKVSTEKNFNSELGLGYFNNLYKNRKDLEIVMPALNKNSYNVKICAENNWNIVISNFCSHEIIDNHIDSYIKHSKLKKKEALKKIKLSKLIFVTENSNQASEFLSKDDSPYLNVVDILYRKLKTFNKHDCFGENISNSREALENIAIYGSPTDVKKKLEYYNDKYGDLSSIVYVSVPKTDNKIFENSLELFAKYV
jgi:alkanesulfonate monooxygenase SsuD/methylene tetrahydromethanopterin reductase-like flavin-dependent oxidoreductase (luciferase family)